jgi:hypothetical protein
MVMVMHSHKMEWSEMVLHTLLPRGCSLSLSLVSVYDIIPSKFLVTHSFSISLSLLLSISHLLA